MTEVAVTEVLGGALPQPGRLALDKAFHGTLARNFCEKLSIGRDLGAEELR